MPLVTTHSTHFLCPVHVCLFSMLQLSCWFLFFSVFEDFISVLLHGGVCVVTSVAQLVKLIPFCSQIWWEVERFHIKRSLLFNSFNEKMENDHALTEIPIIQSNFWKVPRMRGKKASWKRMAKSSNNSGAEPLFPKKHPIVAYCFPLHSHWLRLRHHHPAVPSPLQQQWLAYVLSARAQQRWSKVWLNLASLPWST